MNDKDNKELIRVIEQMINDKVQLIYGGQIIDWEDTQIPEIIQKIKENNQIDQNIVFENSDN